jgi:Uma2 family endonuclease
MAMGEPVPQLSYDEYLRLERESDEKHEWLDGVLYAMAGGTYEHGRLAAALIRELGIALRGMPCNVLSSDVRVRILATRRATYPDVAVVCGKPEHPPDDPHAILNPTVLVEVLSDSTEKGDRGDKWAHYQHLESLREYVLVSQSEPRIEVFSRSGEGWAYRAYERGTSFMLPSLAASISVDEVYRDPTAG